MDNYVYNCYPPPNQDAKMKYISLEGCTMVAHYMSFVGVVNGHDIDRHGLTVRRRRRLRAPRRDPAAASRSMSISSSYSSTLQQQLLQHLQQDLLQLLQ